MNKANLIEHLRDVHGQALTERRQARLTGTLTELNRLHTHLHLPGWANHSHAAKPKEKQPMSTDLPAVPAPNLQLDLKRDLTPAEGAALRAHAMEYVPVDGFERPIPRFMEGLPRYENADAIKDALAARLLTSPDPDRIPDEDGSISFQKLVGRDITVWDVAVMPGTQPDGWAGYLLMDITIGDDLEHLVANTGAREPVVRLAMAWYMDALPIKGRPIYKPVKTASGNKPLMFVAETDLG